MIEHYTQGFWFYLLVFYILTQGLMIAGACVVAVVCGLRFMAARLRSKRIG